jgi:hypothetical protein
MGVRHQKAKIKIADTGDTGVTPRPEPPWLQVDLERPMVGIIDSGNQAAVAVLRLASAAAGTEDMAA